VAVCSTEERGKEKERGVIMLGTHFWE